MRRIIHWLRSWFATSRADLSLSRTKDLLRQTEAAAAESLARIDKRADELHDAIDSVLKEIDDARRLQRRYEFALEEAREQNKVLETTIQTLVASHKLIVERYDAETALAVRARVAASTRE